MWSFGVVDRASSWKRALRPVKSRHLLVTLRKQWYWMTHRGPWEPGELAVTSTCPLKNVTNTPDGESVCCGTTGFTKSGLTSVVGHGFAAEWSQKRARFAERPSGLLGMFCLVNSRNLVFSSLAITMQVCTPRSQVFLCLRLAEQAISSGPLRNASNTA